MTETRDPRVREVVLRIVELAPEPPDFPLGETVPVPPRRRVREMAAASSIVALAVIVGVVAYVAARGGDDATRPTRRVTVQPPPGPPDPLAGQALPQTGLAFAGLDHVEVTDDNGRSLATLRMPNPGSDVMNSSWNVGLVITRSGLRYRHPGFPVQAGAPSGCTITASNGRVRVAVCGTRTLDTLHGDRLMVDTGKGWSDLIGAPPAPPGRANGGGWQWAAPSPDGAWVAASWSGECESQHSFLVSIADHTVYATTGQAGAAWFDGAPESPLIGWSAAGDALIKLGPSDCGIAGAKRAGVYAVSPSDRSRHLVRAFPAGTLIVLRWTSVDDQRTSTTIAPAAPIAPIRLVAPAALAVAPDGTLFISDTERQRVLALSPSGALRAVVDVDRPAGLAVHDGSLFVADAANGTVESVASDGTATIVAGTGVPGFSGDGGPATRAQLFEPESIAFGPDGALYIADAGNSRVRRVGLDGNITTIAGDGTPAYRGDDGPATRASLDASDVAFDGAGNLYVYSPDVKVIRRIDRNGMISSVMPNVYASALATTPGGRVLIADYGAFGLSEITDKGTVRAVPFTHTGRFRPSAIGVAHNGDIYIADDGRGSGGPMRVLRVRPDGTSLDVTPRP